MVVWSCQGTSQTIRLHGHHHHSRKICQLVGRPHAIPDASVATLATEPHKGGLCTNLALRCRRETCPELESLVHRRHRQQHQWQACWSVEVQAAKLPPKGRCCLVVLQMQHEVGCSIGDHGLLFAATWARAPKTLTGMLMDFCCVLLKPGVQAIRAMQSVCAVRWLRTTMCFGPGGLCQIRHT